MQTITDDLRDILKSHFQAGADGFRARIEVGLETIPETCETFLNVMINDPDGRVHLTLAAPFPVDAVLEVTTVIDYGPVTIWDSNPATGELSFYPDYGDTGYYDSVTVCYGGGPGDVTPYRIIRASPSKSLANDADRLDLEIDNSDGSVQVDGDPTILPDTPARLFVWYGPQENEVQVFSMLIDRVTLGRHPNTVAITGRDWMKKLIVQSVGLISSQDVDDTDAYVRDETNYVYLGWEISDIVVDLLDKANFPVDHRAITTTSVTVDEFRGNDDEPLAGTIGRLADIVSYFSFADEDGIYHFEPIDNTEGAVDYTFKTGEDVLSLSYETNDDQLFTRVSVKGPMTVSSSIDAWEEVWQSSNVTNPVGVWYDPADSAHIQVLDSHTKRMYLMQQSDQAVVSSIYLGGSAPYPLGLSGDPADSDAYYVLSAPWAFGYTANNNKIIKFKKSDNSVLLVFSLPNGRWSDLKVSAANIWLTNLDDDKFWKFDRTTGNPVTGYGLYGSGIIFPDPTGVAVDGTEITVFYTEGHSYVMDESAPTTVIRSILSAAGMWGGDWDVDTHTELYVVGSAQHSTWKYTTTTTVETSFDVIAEAIDEDLEALLLELTGYPEIRRKIVTLPAIISLADAQAMAEQILLSLAKFGDSLDVGIIGNPAIQKGDKVRIEDPVMGVASNWQVISYRSDLSGESGTYLGILSLKRLVA